MGKDRRLQVYLSNDQAGSRRRSPDTGCCERAAERRDGLAHEIFIFFTLQSLPAIISTSRSPQSGHLTAGRIKWSFSKNSIGPLYEHFLQFIKGLITWILYLAPSAIVPEVIVSKMNLIWSGLSAVSSPISMNTSFTFFASFFFAASSTASTMAPAIETSCISLHSLTTSISDFSWMHLAAA